MKTAARSYNHDADYDRVGEFLVRTFRIAGEHINWLQPRWEYMHYHPLIRDVDLAPIGVWEASGRIVAVVHPEHWTGVVYIEVEPPYAPPPEEMLVYAEEHLRAAKDDGKALEVYINDRDQRSQAAAAEMGYSKLDKGEAMSDMIIPDPFPAISLPDGFRLKSLAEDNDLRKLDRALWRGFDHGDEPPDGGIEDRKFMQSAPNYNKDLQIAVEAPDGHFVSYCGMWYEPVHKIAYVEPVCTDPDYRRMGLGKAAVLEGIRRCGQLGAKVAYVGAIRPFYLSMGFKQIYNCSAWRREWM
jgi:GNAT superfamily N-acetyltransferase